MRYIWNMPIQQKIGLAIAIAYHLYVALKYYDVIP